MPSTMKRMASAMMIALCGEDDDVGFLLATVARTRPLGGVVVVVVGGRGGAQPVAVTLLLVSVAVLVMFWLHVLDCVKLLRDELLAYKLLTQLVRLVLGHVGLALRTDRDTSFWAHGGKLHATELLPATMPGYWLLSAV